MESGRGPVLPYVLQAANWMVNAAVAPASLPSFGRSASSFEAVTSSSDVPAIVPGTTVIRVSLGSYDAHVARRK